MSEHEAVFALNPILPKFLQVRQMKSHQNKVKLKEKLTLSEQLNSIADELADTYITFPKQCNIPCTPVAMYFNGYYIANDYQHKLRSICHFNQAKTFMKNQYNWSSKTFNGIEWTIHYRMI